MKTTPPLQGQKPKQRRGHFRVAAIMKTAVEVFTEKGYDAATMAEIGARSGTATASLYRFFPSKDSLADALLLQYETHAMNRLAELRSQAEDMTPDQIADALVDFRLSMQSQRRFAIDLADSRGGTHDRRQQFQSAMLGSVAGILKEGIPSLTKAKSEAMAFVLLHLFRNLAQIDGQKPATRRVILGEIKALVRGYLISAKSSASHIF
jgi:AcrR family transcriptional regulator